MPYCQAVRSRLLSCCSSGSADDFRAFSKPVEVQGWYPFQAGARVSDLRMEIIELKRVFLLVILRVPFFALSPFLPSASVSFLSRL